MRAIRISLKKWDRPFVRITNTDAIIKTITDCVVTIVLGGGLLVAMIALSQLVIV